MSQDTYVGIDSGGTRTNVAILVEGSDGNRSTTYESGDSLSGALSPSAMSATLRRMIAPLPRRLEDLGASSSEIYLWISAAGYTEWTRSDLIRAMEDALPAVGGVRAMGCANDGISALLGSRADGIVIAGTGSTAIVRTKTGELAQAGGHEWVACDHGSGFWIGLNAIRTAYRDFASGTDSVLLQRFRQVYGIRSDDDRAFIAKLRDLAIADSNMKKEIARFTSSVCDAADRGDTAAQDIVKKHSEDLADVSASLVRRQFSRSDLAAGIAIIEVGGLLSNELYRSSFEAHLELRLRAGLDERAVVTWHRAVTATSACIQLAKDLKEGNTEFLKLDLAFRPAVVRPGAG
jgi:N-acetylglucosamine kinase-like BadF-type ATPase